MVFERLRALIAEQFSISAATIFMDTSFVDDLGADSLDAVDLTMAITAEFDVSEADEETIMDFITVGDVVRYLSGNYD
ncbi:MAG: acyl carrier protein [Oscillospiraceae bacterium]|jgi:acyl carrier protein|nr:acyl carrier protein [Oscillospiraceae bacterium]